MSVLLRRSVLLNRFAMARLLPVFLATIFFSPAAHATNVALTGDAHVSMTRSTTNFGTLSNLYVGNGNTALLQFDLSTLPAGLTSSQVAHATLTVFVNRVNSGGAVNLAPVTSAWNESAVTYATIPAIGAPVNGFTAANAGQYITLDVTSLVQGWVTAPATNFGLALTSMAANLLLDSKENDETGHAASLDITVTSMGATGAQGPEGMQGVQGTAGVNGVPGIPGATGPAGPVGPTGATGANGTLGIVSNWSSSTMYQAGQVVFCAACSSNGSSYAALATNTNQDPPTQVGFWQLIAQAGATGATGAAGATGATGSTGAPGPVGPSGPIGETGATGTLGIVTNWSPTVAYQVGQVVFCAACSNSGSSYVALTANTNQDPPTQTGIWQLIARVGAVGAPGIIGPAGPAGSTGATGPAGPTGPTGATGTLGVVTNWSSGSPYLVGQVVFCAACSSNGSSYIALATNTNIDPPTNPAIWHLIAQAGSAGAAGATGATGPAGPVGPTGATGATGAPGTGSVTSVVVGTVTNSGTTGTLSVSNATTTPTLNINFPASSGGSTGFTFSGSYNNASLGTVFMNPVGFASQDVSQLAFNTAPATCTARSLTVNSITSNAISPTIFVDTTVFTVLRNDALTSMTCSITNATTNNSTASCSDSTHTFAVSQEDRISLQVAESLTNGNTVLDFDMVSYATTFVCN
jgi:Collagen triple helix repeat (20 copies)